MRKNQNSFSSSRFLSNPILTGYLIIIILAVFLQFIQNYFVADDFTWLHWASQCKDITCRSTAQLFLSYFLQSGNFFYRPGMKIYFYLMSNVFGYTPIFYHVFSLLIHILCSILVFFIAKKILRKSVDAFVVSLAFSLLASHAETIMWVSSVGHLLASFFILLGLYLFMLWEDMRNNWMLFGSVICTFFAPLFHEYGVIAPLLVFAFELVWYHTSTLRWKEKLFYLWYILASVVYFSLKIISHSFWSAGDYRYNLMKLPFNGIGNSIGDAVIGLFGNPVFVVYNNIRSSFRSHLLVSGVVVLVGLFILFIAFKFSRNLWKAGTRKLLLVSLVFFFVPLLPFLGLGNTAMRYVYISSFGSLLFVVVVIQIITQKWNKAPWRFIIGCGLLVFLVYQVVQLQMSYHDWWMAGGITRSFVLTMRQHKQENMNAGKVYIANVPYTFGQAWVFPAGLADAVWLASGRRSVTVATLPSGENASMIAKKTVLPVYIFQNNLEVEYIKK